MPQAPRDRCDLDVDLLHGPSHPAQFGRDHAELAGRTQVERPDGPHRHDASQ
jgi:hypothetical protein